MMVLRLTALEVRNEGEQDTPVRDSMTAKRLDAEVFRGVCWVQDGARGRGLKEHNQALHHFRRFCNHHAAAMVEAKEFDGVRPVDPKEASEGPATVLTFTTDLGLNLAGPAALKKPTEATGPLRRYEDPLVIVLGRHPDWTFGTRRIPLTLWSPTRSKWPST